MACSVKYSTIEDLQKKKIIDGRFIKNLPQFNKINEELSDFVNNTYNLELGLPFKVNIKESKNITNSRLERLNAGRSTITYDVNEEFFNVYQEERDSAYEKSKELESLFGEDTQINEVNDEGDIIPSNQTIEAKLQEMIESGEITQTCKI